MTDLKDDIKYVKDFTKEVGRKTGSMIKRTLILTKEYTKAGVNRCYCGFKRVVKEVAECLMYDDE